MGHRQPYRLLRLGPCHLEAIERVALPVPAQLTGDHRLHAAQEGEQPGRIGLGHKDGGRRGGLRLHLDVCALLGLGARLGCGDAGCLATLL